MPSYGADLPDSESIVNQHAERWISFLPTLSEFAQTRAKLEKEFAKQLMQAASAARLNAVKAAQGLTIDELYLKYLECQDMDARAHQEYADELAKEAATLEQLGKRFEHVRKSHHAFAGKLFGERDKAYDARNHSKSRYFASCDGLEQARQKKSSSKDPQKANKAYDAAEQDMHDHKNQFIIDNDSANVTKARLYGTDLPALHDDYQILEQSTVSAITAQLSGIALHHDAVISKLQQNVSTLRGAIAAVDVDADQQRFVDQHRSQLTAFENPPDLTFEESPVWHDTAEMSTTPASIVYLNNIKLRNQSRLNEVTPLVESKQKESGGLRNLRDAYEKDRKLGDPAAILESLFESVHENTLLEIQQSQCEAQIELIDENLGDEANAVLNKHDLKASSFVTPATCVVCDSSVWGKGMSCRSCGAAVHAKCELKMPANCSNSTGSSSSSPSGKRRSTAKRLSETATTTRSATSTPRASMEAPPTRTSTEATTRTTVTMLYDYEARSEIEMSASVGQVLHVVEPDDGSGWLKARAPDGTIGLVPSSYTQAGGALPSQSLSQAAAGRTRAVRVLYEYGAQTNDELSVSEGETVELVSTRDDGWTQVSKGGSRGLVPTSYLEL